MIFTQAQFEGYIQLITQNPSYQLTSPQLGLFLLYLDMYTNQLAELDMFDTSNTIESRDYPIHHCELTYLSIPLWQDNNSFAIEKCRYGSNTSLVLNKNQQYTPVKSKIVSNNYITDINFKCLSCNCECEYIRITGNYGIKIPAYILNAIMNIIYSNIQGGSAVLGGSDCCANIKSKSDGAGFSVTYYDKQVTSTLTKNKDNLLSFPIIYNWVSKYSLHFFQL